VAESPEAPYWPPQIEPNCYRPARQSDATNRLLIG